MDEPPPLWVFTGPFGCIQGTDGESRGRENSRQKQVGWEAVSSYVAYERDFEPEATRRQRGFVLTLNGQTEGLARRSCLS